MAAPTILQGSFTCSVTLQVVRAPIFVRHDTAGVTYLTGRDYELAYETVLRFDGGAELPIKGKLFGELNQQVVIRDARGRPVQISGFTQGRSEISDGDARKIFEGRYYDSRITQGLSGDGSLTLVGQRVIDHWQNGLGHGAYAGHAFSLGGRLIREGDARPTGEACGHID